MRFTKWPQLPGAGRTRVGHHHGSHTPTSPEAVLLHKQATLGKHFEPECTSVPFLNFIFGLNGGPFCFTIPTALQINEISLKNSFTFDHNNMNFLNDRNSWTLIFLYWEIKVKFTIACLKIKPSHEMLISFGNELFLELLEKSMWLRKYARGWFFKRE